ncbi:MAG: FHA domain-containing protein [Vicinamibacteria bacterium]
MPSIPVSCARCGEELSEPGVTCPSCGATRPDPAWTQPVGAAGATIQSRSVSGGGLANGKRYALILVSGEESGRVIPLQKARVTLGRAGCDVSFQDPELSRQHALISINGMNARLEDLGSTNGTFVDGERIDSTELWDRSEFRIGMQELVFVMRDEEEH